MNCRYLYSLLMSFGCLIFLNHSLFSGLMQIKSLVSKEPITQQSQITSLAKQIEVIEERIRELREESGQDTETLERVSSELNVIKGQIKIAPQDHIDFLNKKLSIVSRTYQSVTEIAQTRRQMITQLEEHDKALREFQLDPYFESLQRPIKASPDFEDLQKSASRLFSHKGRLDELVKAKKTAEADKEKRKKALDSVTKEYEEKKQQHQSFTQGAKIDPALAGFTHNQQGELLDAELKQIEYKQKLAKLKLSEDTLKISTLETKITILNKQVTLLQQEYSNVKRSVTIDTAYVKKAEDKLEKKRQEFFNKRDRLNEKIRILLPLQNQYQQRIDEALNRFDLSVSDVAAAKSWTREADTLETVNEWVGTLVIGALSAQLKLVETQVQLLEAQVNQAKIDFRYDDRELAILRSWHRITQRQLRPNFEEEIEQEIKRYEAERSQLKVDLAELYENRDKVINLLYKLNIARDKNKVLSKALAEQKSLIFAGANKQYQESAQALMRADEELRTRVNFIGKLMEVYAKSIARVRDGIKKIEDVENELSAKSFWMRSTQSIEWRDLKNFMPDIERFVDDIKTSGYKYIAKIHVPTILNKIIRYVKVPYLAILLFLRLLIACIVYILLWTYLPDLRNYFMKGESRFRFVSRVRTFIAAILEFVNGHLTGLYLWLLGFIALQLSLIDHYLAIWFYLLSIPYLLSIAYLFFQHLFAINKNKGYIFIGQQFQQRFALVVPLLVYVTILLSFFRQAFALGNYYSSSVPDILFAINIISLQIALISLISKELVLGAISFRDTPFADWLEERVDKYYYLFLLGFIAIVVMINPYVGYGRQVFYVLSRLLLTCLLVPLLSWLHNRIKRASSDFFFYYSDGSAVKERFPAGKGWYGIFVLASFFVFVCLGFFVVARVWGHTLGLYDISKWLNYTLYSPGIDEVTGQPIQVSVLSLFKIVAYVVGGIVIAYVANRFVLRRIFDPLLIGSGVQNTILTLSRYAFILVAFLIGLQSAGLDAMATKLAVLIGIIGFAIKEPIADFFSYFIILVQRPIKIGDLIKIEPDIFGVVRHITPRSTIVRHKNSLTLVVPNSTIITHMVQNWHYSRTFGAFRDISITIPYTVDPDQARKLLFEVLDANPNILKNPTPIVWLVNFADHGFEFSVRGFLSADKVIELFDIESEVRLAMVRRLREAGIKIAVPTRILVSEKGTPLGLIENAEIGESK